MPQECTDCVRINEKEGVVRIGDPTKKDYDKNDISTWREFTYDTVFDKKTGTQQAVYDKAVKGVFDKVICGNF